MLTRGWLRWYALQGSGNITMGGEAYPCMLSTYPPINSPVFARSCCFSYAEKSTDSSTTFSIYQLQSLVYLFGSNRHCCVWEELYSEVTDLQQLQDTIIVAEDIIWVTHTIRLLEYTCNIRLNESIYGKRQLSKEEENRTILSICWLIRRRFLLLRTTFFVDSWSSNAGLPNINTTSRPRYF
ncbi:hypothetical protein VTL71DRAFT_7883 [Oculimacula yallundae]|uniref:Uncharacterized protein n=1 Tax=Oculimacula yallundae TaxID=86028 RepID=A0ABR4CVZ2_9HELO